MIEVAATTGMRQGELFGLTRDRVGDDQIVVDRQPIKTSAGRHLAPPKTDASVRVIPIPTDVVDQIRDHVDRFGPGVDGLVFAGATGE